MKIKNVFLLLCTTVLAQAQNNELFKDCTRELYDRVVRFEYLYYEGYWMYPYNKLRNHGPSYHYTERDFCKLFSAAGHLASNFLARRTLVQMTFVH